MLNLYKGLVVTAVIYLGGLYPLLVFSGDSAVHKSVDPSAVIIRDGDHTVSRYEVLMMFADMLPAQREKLLAKPDGLKNLLYDDITLKKKAAEAEQKGLHDTALMKWKEEKTRQKLLAQELEKSWRDNLELSQDFEVLAREYYDAHPEEFRVEEKIKAAHILFRVDVDNEQQLNEERIKAERVLGQLKNNELAFSDAVKKYSGDKSSVSSSGELGYFSRGRMVKPFEKAAFGLKNQGDLSQIVQTRFGLHIIRLIERVEKSIVPFEEVKLKLIGQQKEKFIRAAHAKYLSTFDIDQDTTVYMDILHELENELGKSISVEPGPGD